MRIGFGCSVLARSLNSKGIDGLGVYTRELYRHLLGIADLSLLPISFGYKVDNGSGLINPTILGKFSSSVAIASMSGISFKGSRKLESKIDLFHATDHHIPNLRKIPVVATIHDAIPIANPEWMSLRYRMLITPIFRHSAQWASQVITISEYSKKQVSNYFKIDPDVIHVVYNGVDHRWFVKPLYEDVESARVRYDITKRYVVTVGTLQPRKNIERLIAAYLALPQDFQDEFDLVVIGREGWGSAEIVEKFKANAFGDRVKWLSHVPQRELETLVKGADCLAFPSLAEGFGLPIVEAFAAGIPVIAANSSSIPEVAGDAAYLFDPFDVGAIRDALMKILDNAAFRSMLQQKGLERAKKFTWDNTARKVVDTYRLVLGR